MLADEPIQQYLLGWLHAFPSRYEVADDCTSVTLWFETCDEYDLWFQNIPDRLRETYVLNRPKHQTLVSYFFGAFRRNPSQACAASLVVSDPMIVNIVSTKGWWAQCHTQDTASRCFKRGYFDAVGHVELSRDGCIIRCSVPANNRSWLLFRSDVCTYSLERSKHPSHSPTTAWDGFDAFHFLCDLYDVVGVHTNPSTAIPGHHVNCYSTRTMVAINRTKWTHITETAAGLPSGCDYYMSAVFYTKIREAAIDPTRTLASHPDFTVSVCERVDTDDHADDSLEAYATGLRFSCEHGRYLEIRTSDHLCEQGYALANPSGYIVAPGCIDELVVTLRRVVPTAKELQLPFPALSVIVRHTVPAEMQAIDPSTLHAYSKTNAIE